MTNVTQNCQPWCSNHTVDSDSGWCASTPIKYDGASLHLSTATEDGSPAIFGLEALGDAPWTVAGARGLARTLEQLAKLATAPRASLAATVECNRPGCDSSFNGKRHAVGADGTVVHYQGWGSHMERDESGTLQTRWRVGAIARGDEPWQVGLDANGHILWLDDEQAERLAEGITHSVISGLRCDVQRHAEEAMHLRVAESSPANRLGTSPGATGRVGMSAS